MSRRLCFIIGRLLPWLSRLAAFDVRHILDGELAQPTRVQEDFAFAMHVEHGENVRLANEGVTDHRIRERPAATVYREEFRNRWIGRPREIAKGAPIRAAPTSTSSGRLS